MRKSKAIDALFPATRRDVLAAVLLHADRAWYLSDLARHLGRPPSSLQREMVSLVEAGILRRKRDGNRVYFEADDDCPFLTELRGILLKTVGLVDVLREVLEPFVPRIEWAFIYGSIARNEELSRSDVDLMIIGRLGLADLAPALPAAEHRLLRPINPTLFTHAEVAKKLKTGHHFLKTVFSQQKLFIVGRDDDLATTFGIQTGPTASNKSG